MLPITTLRQIKLVQEYVLLIYILVVYKLETCLTHGCAHNIWHLLLSQHLFTNYFSFFFCFRCRHPRNRRKEYYYIHFFTLRCIPWASCLPSSVWFSKYMDSNNFLTEDFRECFNLPIFNLNLGINWDIFGSRLGQILACFVHFEGAVLKNNHVP